MVPCWSGTKEISIRECFPLRNWRKRWEQSSCRPSVLNIRWSAHHWVWSVRLRGGLAWLEPNQERLSSLLREFLGKALVSCLSMYLGCAVKSQNKQNNDRDLVHHSCPLPTTSSFKICLYPKEPLPPPCHLINRSLKESLLPACDESCWMDVWWKMSNHWEGTLHLVNIYCVPGTIWGTFLCHFTFHTIPVIYACKVPVLQIKKQTQRCGVSCPGWIRYSAGIRIYSRSDFSARSWRAAKCQVKEFGILLEGDRELLTRSNSLIYERRHFPLEYTQRSCASIKAVFKPLPFLWALVKLLGLVLLYVVNTICAVWLQPWGFLEPAESQGRSHISCLVWNILHGLPQFPHSLCHPCSQKWWLCALE